jgi:cardiolipin synthase
MRSLIVLLILFITCPLYSLPAEDIEIINNISYFGKVDEMIKGAKKSIYVIMFSMQYYDAYPDSPSNILLKDLALAVKRGVDVKVIVEGGETDRKGKNELIDNKRAIRFLKENNVPCVIDPPDITTHSKLLIIDGIYVVIGSTNWSYSALSKNNETSIIIKSAEAAVLYKKYFDEILLETRKK